MLPPLASSNSSRIGLFYSIGIMSPICILHTQVILILVVEGFSHLLTPIPIRVHKPYCLTTKLNKPCSNMGWSMGYSITPTITHLNLKFLFFFTMREAQILPMERG